VLAAQDKPNFAGVWKMTTAATDGAGFTPEEMTVTQDAKSLVVSATLQMGPMKTSYNLDGTEGKSPLEFNGMSIDRATKASWDGARLVLVTTSNFNGQSFETKQVWSLGADGTLTVENTRPDFQGGGSPVTTKVAYKKS
jgi:hypothetical protein